MTTDKPSLKQMAEQAISNVRPSENEVYLWQLLDDIDTLGDIHKPVRDGYFDSVNRIAHKRFNILSSDGHNLKRVSPTTAPAKVPSESEIDGELLNRVIWETCMEMTAWCGWPNRARLDLVREVRDNVRKVLEDLGLKFMTVKCSETESASRRDVLPITEEYRWKIKVLNNIRLAATEDGKPTREIVDECIALANDHIKELMEEVKREYVLKSAKDGE